MFNCMLGPYYEDLLNLSAFVLTDNEKSDIIVNSVTAQCADCAAACKNEDVKGGVRVAERRSDPWAIARRMLASALLVGGVILVGWLVLRQVGWHTLSREQLQDKIASFGAWAPLIFILLSFLQVTFIPIPSTVTILAGNYVFGAWRSSVYSWIGIMAGSILAFWLGRLLGRPFVNWVFGSREKADEMLSKLHGREVVLLFFMFLLPMFPDDALCAVAGLLRVRFLTFVFMQVLSRTVAIAGTLFFMSGEVIPLHGWGLVVIALVAVLSLVAFVLAYRHAEAFNAVLDRISDKFAGAARRAARKTRDRVRHRTGHDEK